MVLLFLLGAGPVTHPATTRSARLPAVHTVALHALAMSTGDAEGVRRLYLARTDEEKKVAAAYAGMAATIGRLRTIADARSGKEGFDSIGFGPMFRAEVERLKKVETEENGDEAKVYTGGKDKPPRVLEFVGGEWKISVAKSYPGKMERRGARIRAQAGAYYELGSEIKEGVYKDPGAVMAAGAQKVSKAMAEVEKEFGKKEVAK